MYLSREELEAGNLNADTLRRAVEAVRSQAFVVLEGLLDAAAVRQARVTCEAIVERKHKDSIPLPYELLHRFPFKDFASHPIVLQGVSAVLGGEAAPQGFRWIRRCPPGGSAIARIHRDTAGFASSESGQLPLQLSVDIMLTEFTEENGATEIWPGTQHTVEADVAEHKSIGESIGEKARRMPCLRITGPAGAISIRDQRAWHRSGVNRTRDDRLMLAVGHWRRLKQDAPTPEGCGAFFGS